MRGRKFEAEVETDRDSRVASEIVGADVGVTKIGSSGSSRWGIGRSEACKAEENRCQLRNLK